MKDFEKKTVVVTGATSGLGRAIALELSRRGAQVAFCGRNEAAGQETLRLVENQAGTGLFIQCDIGQPNDVHKFFDKVMSQFGKIDAAINNAGISGQLTEVVDYPLDVWNEVVNVNLTGTFLCLQREIAELTGSGGGAIVNVASALGLRGKEKTSAYSATKHAIIGLTKCAALECGPAGIRVNALCPGGISTEMDDEFYKNVDDAEALRKKRLASYALGRLATPVEVARSAIWLCSDESGFVTGTTVSVDGGKTAR